MKDNQLKLRSVKIKGYKSIRPQGQSIDFQGITVLLGANGSGKSNLVSFFSMLNYMMSGSLQNYIGENGSADSMLYYGASMTPRMEAELTFTNLTDKDIYKFILSHAAGDTLIFNEESIEWYKGGNGTSSPFKITLDPGTKESGLFERTKNKNAKTERVIFNLLKNCQVFQFHDTSKSSRIRNKNYINDNKFLRSDGGNLAAFLYSIKNSNRKYYDRIVRYIRQIMPQFGDFILHPSSLNENYIMLDWTQSDADYHFGAHQISDGSLRFMCLTTLLLQPPDTLPSVIILDEPELGLHPSAIAILAGMAKTASRYCQIIMATQSPRLVDEFDSANIVIVERNPLENCSEYKVLNEDKLTDWIERYSLSELWEKNVLGGQP